MTDPRCDARHDTHLATARVTIDLSALAANWRLLARLAPKAETAAVVKADAYGLGADRIAPALMRAGCRTFFAAVPGEAVRLRAVAGDARIFVFAGLFAESAPVYSEHGLIPVLNRPADIAAWRAEAKRTGRRLACALHVDTGMNRLGLDYTEAQAVAGDPAALQGLDPVLVVSHLACADEPSHPMNGLQRQRFERFRQLFPGIAASLANSAGILQEAGFAYDLTRAGIALHGGEAIEGMADTMATVATLEARIVQVRRARKGDVVGYGASVTLTRDSRIAIAAAGYADGYMRSASGSGVAMRRVNEGAMGAIGGQEVPLVGRISMDLAAFDVTDVPEDVLDRAEWIELFGPTIRLDDFARAAGTIGYEVLTGLGPRVARAYVGG